MFSVQGFYVCHPRSSKYQHQLSLEGRVLDTFNSVGLTLCWAALRGDEQTSKATEGYEPQLERSKAYSTF